MLPGIKNGDKLVYNQVNEKNDIVTWVDGKNIDYKKFSDYGDVIIYQSYGDKNFDYIVHRAMAWVKYNEVNDTYTIDGYDIENEMIINIYEIGLSNYKPSPSGFITKGDNPETNKYCDQATTLCKEPVKVDWIIGKVIKIRK